MAATAELRQNAQAILHRLSDDPVWFSTAILGDDPWSTPRAFLKALSRPHARVAVKACHSSGKTHTSAAAVLWWVCRGGIAVTTAPTWTQVEKMLWKEIRTFYGRARFPLGGTMLTTEYRLGPDQFAIGISTNEGVNFQGWHGDVLIVLDEAPGVRPDIFEAIEGVRAGGDVRVLMLGNPTLASGPFYDAFGRQRAGWQAFTIDAFASPNLRDLYPPDVDPATLGDDEAIGPLLALPDEALDDNARPYLTTRRWVLEKWHDWTPQSPLWQARVRGRFPKQSEDALISLTWLERAELSTLAPAESDDWEAGIDVAGPGEAETVLGVRHGPRLVELRAWPQPDPRGEVLAALRPYESRLKRVKVDSIGQGYYFARHLEDHGYAGRVADVNVGEAASDSERYVNWKAELYWALRQRFAAGAIGGVTDETAIAQLAGIRYRHNARGQVVIESKEEARKRGVPSPDRAEAIMLTYAPARLEPTVQAMSVPGFGVAGGTRPRPEPAHLRHRRR